MKDLTKDEIAFVNALLSNYCLRNEKDDFSIRLWKKFSDGLEEKIQKEKVVEAHEPQSANRIGGATCRKYI